MLEKVEKYNNILEYTRGKEDMSKKHNKNKGKNTKPQTPVVVETKSKSKWFLVIRKKATRFLSSNLVAIVLSAIVIPAGGNFLNKFEKMETDVEVMKANIENLQYNYQILNGNVWSINDFLLGETGNLEESEKTLLASEGFSEGMENAKSTNKGTEPVVDMLSFKKETVIGINAENNKEETRKSVENKPFITSYEEDGEEVFFYGKYNEDGQWDGNCIINRYKDSKLTFVMEAEYDKGELKSYKQIFRGKNSDQREIWYVADRETEGDRNKGETATYFFYGDYEKDFDMKTAKAEKILTVDKFLETIPSTMEGYYSGYTSDGKYNDDSGKAYLVKYDGSGRVRFFYTGKIKNGYPEDDTGNAWSISLGYDGSGYYYYKGKFKNGNREKTPKNWKPMTQEEINEKINPDDYECPLKGLFEQEF